MDTNISKQGSRESRDAGLGKPSFNCPRCGTFAQQTWYLAQLASTSGPNSFVDDAVDEELTFATASRSMMQKSNKTQWKFSKCLACNKKSVWRGADLIFPASTPIPIGSPDLPPDVAELYEEARQVFQVSKRASAALARAALELLLYSVVPHVPGKNSLFDLIDRVQGSLSTDTCRVLTVVRQLGNNVLHPDLKNPEIVALYLSDETTEMASLVFETINRVVDELVTKPRITTEFLSKLETPSA